MHEHYIKSLFQPRSVAVFGASEQEGAVGTTLFRNLLTGGFEGPIHPINPKRETVQGVKAHPSLQALNERVDLAVVVTPAPTVPDIIASCGESGVRAAVIISAGFREAGEEGKRLEARVLEVARRTGVRFLGPNCLGLMRPDIGLNATFSASNARQGSLALVSQSGALCTAILDWAETNAVGFSSVISTGISADVDFGEILDFLVNDAKTRSILLYIEGLHDARRFMSALRAAARVKPVIVMKTGRHQSGSAAAVSHTGALVGADDVFDSALSRAGAVRVKSFTHMFAAATTLSSGLRVVGERLGVVTNGGGPGVVVADVLTDKGLPVAELSEATLAKLDAVLPAAWSHGNPVDVIGDAGAPRFEQATRICLEAPEVDAVLVMLTPQAMTPTTEVAEKVAALASTGGKPLLTCWMGDRGVADARRVFTENNVPTYRTPESAVEAFAAMAAYHRNKALLLQVPEPLGRQKPPDVEGARMIIDAVLAEHRHVLTPLESKALLAAFRLPVVRSVLVRSPTEALLIAEEFGFPVVAKVSSPDITHKSDIGGVRLDIRDAHELRVAVRELLEGVAKRAPEATIEGVIIERMMRRRGGRELMVGVATDPVFGPVISVGLGGTAVEVLGDRAISLPPLNRYLASRMIESTRAARLLGAFRDMPRANVAALERVLMRVSEMVCELPEIEELDINPILVDEKGAVAIDARVSVRRRPAGERQYAHMAIHPYPAALVAGWQLPDGTEIVIRPIRPEDAVIERAFVNGLSEQSKHFRFMYALHEITPEMLSSFTQIDYDREMALIATVEQAGAEIEIGVARYVTQLDGESCEFAVVVADAWQGRGVASRLMRCLIDVARDRGLARMEGQVLADNRGMLALAREVGFAIQRDPESPELMNLSRPL